MPAELRQAAQRVAEATAVSRHSSSSVVDAFLAQLALPGDQMLTSDPGDLASLLAARAINATIVTV